MTTLYLRASGHAGRSYRGFRWPLAGPVEAPDWDPAVFDEGHALHGDPWGCGEPEGRRQWRAWCENSGYDLFQVVAVEPEHVHGRQPQKFGRGEVRFLGAFDDAIAYLVEQAPPGLAIPWAKIDAGPGGRAVVGHFGKATAEGNGTAVAGEEGIASTGDGGVAITGSRGTATAGVGGTVAAGHGGTLRLHRLEPSSRRPQVRRIEAVVGRHGILPNTLYRLDPDSPAYPWMAVGNALAWAAQC